MDFDELIAAAKRQGVTVLIVQQVIHTGPHIEAGSIEIHTAQTPNLPAQPRAALHVPEYVLRKQWEQEHAGDAYASYTEV